MAEAVQLLPQKALETFVRDERCENENGLDKPQNETKSLRAHDLKLSEEVTGKLLELQEKGLKKRMGV